MQNTTARHLTTQNLAVWLTCQSDHRANSPQLVGKSAKVC